MADKKLKDLKKGDRIWYWYFTCTTPIYVDKAKREGDLMRLTIVWDKSVYECFGHALGFTCVGYNREFHEEFMFTSSYDLSKKNEETRQKMRDLVPCLKEVIEKIGKL